jgi:hypothetical protein
VVEFAHTYNKRNFLESRVRGAGGGVKHATGTCDAGAGGVAGHDGGVGEGDDEEEGGRRSRPPLDAGWVVAVCRRCIC